MAGLARVVRLRHTTSTKDFKVWRTHVIDACMRHYSSAGQYWDLSVNTLFAKYKAGMDPEAVAQEYLDGWEE